MVRLRKAPSMAHGVPHHSRTAFLKIPNGYLTTWMISVLRVVRIITTLRGHGRLTLRFSG